MELVILPFRGALVDWAAAVEAVVYDVARVHGQSPLDRGRALRRRLEELGAGGSRPFPAAFEALAAERGYRRAGSGARALERLLGCARLRADVRTALEAVTRVGVPIVVLGDAEPELVEAVLRPLDGAFEQVVHVESAGPDASSVALASTLRRTGAAPEGVLQVCVARDQLRAARELRSGAAWLGRGGRPVPAGEAASVRLQSLAELPGVVADRALSAAV